jgi:hypothetical protein
LTDYIESISSKSPELAQYLIANETDIMLAPVIREAVVEPSKFEFVELEDIIAEGFGEAFEGIPEETIEEGVLPTVEEIEDEEVEAPVEPQRGRFV